MSGAAFGKGTPGKWCFGDVVDAVAAAHSVKMFFAFLFGDSKLIDSRYPPEDDARLEKIYERKALDMEFNCPHCCHKIEADDSFAGGSARCPICNGEITVPVAESSAFGVCPKCGQALTMPDPVICINCGHRFRETPVDPEKKARQRKMRLQMLPSHILGTLVYLATVFVMFVMPLFPLRIVFLSIMLAAVLGMIAAEWAKFIMLRADWRTGLLAIGIVFLAALTIVSYYIWNSVFRLERHTMIESIINDPECVSQYPPEPARDEIHRAALGLYSQTYPEVIMSRLKKGLRTDLCKKYGKQSFPFDYQLKRTIQCIREQFSYYLLVFLRSLFGLSVFNMLLAYVFSLKAHSFFGPVMGFRASWDTELPSHWDDLSEDEAGSAAGDPMFVLALVAVTINALIVGVANVIIWVIMDGMGGRALAMLLVSSSMSAPAIFCFSKCEDRRWILSLPVLVIALIVAVIIWRL